MVIQIRKPDEVEADETDTQTEPETDKETASASDQEETTEKTNDAAELVDGMRPEFKQAMDSYEEFMNEYCEFMEKYAESDGTDVGLLADYAS